MLATTTNLNRFLNKAERIIRNNYNEKGLIVCARIDNVFAINYNGIPFILSVNVAPFDVIVYNIALSSDSKNYIIKSSGTCGNQEAVISDIYVDLLHYVRDNNICLETAETTEETAEKHYDDYVSEDFIKAGIAKECTDCPDFCDYNYKSASCIKAIQNPNWHHVSLKTLTNIDLDELDEKRKLVRDINHILKDGIRNLYKCEKYISFDLLERYVIRKCGEFIRHNRLKAFWFSYIARQLDEVRRNTSYLYMPYITAHRNIW